MLLVMSSSIETNEMNIWIAAFGLVFVLCGVIHTKWTYSWVSKAEAVAGQVIELVEIKDDDTHRPTYAPKIAYQFKGTQRQFIAKWSSTTPPFKIGDRVTVLVSANFTHEAIASMRGLYGATIFEIAVVLALIFTAIASMLGLNGLAGFAMAVILALIFMIIVFTNGDRILRILHPQLG